jgi:hypothetical protein
VWLDIETIKNPCRKLTTHLDPPRPAGVNADLAVSLTPASRQTFTTEFDLPFIDWWPTRSGADDDCVLELSFLDPSRVAALSATLNGKGIEVCHYVYPGKSEWHSFYLNLTGHTQPGKQRLAVTVDWKD